MRGGRLEVKVDGRVAFSCRFQERAAISGRFICMIGCILFHLRATAADSVASQTSPETNSTGMQSLVDIIPPTSAPAPAPYQYNNLTITRPVASPPPPRPGEAPPPANVSEPSPAPLSAILPLPPPPVPSSSNPPPAISPSPGIPPAALPPWTPVNQPSADLTPAPGSPAAGPGGVLYGEGEASKLSGGAKTGLAFLAFAALLQVGAVTFLALRRQQMVAAAREDGNYEHQNGERDTSA